MIESISEIAKSDGALVGLLEKAQEYADICLLAKKRQKGCDGRGELATVKEEFKDSVDVLIRYCKGREYLSGNIQFDIDSMANELAGLMKE